MADEPTKAWRCIVCGYVHRGDAPPDECPVCGASKAEFEPHVEEPAPAAAAPGARQWRCLICMYIHEGDVPPEECPVCGAAASRFEPVAAPTTSQAAAPVDHVVVLGAGIAGIAAVEAIRRASPRTRVTLVSKDTDPPYYRLNLTRYLAGEIDEAALSVHPADWYQSGPIDFLCGVEAAEVCPADKAVLLRGGRRIPFDKLILAAGAHCFVPPLTGSQREGVRTVRSLQDARWILQHLQPGMQCVCIGGGILGVETAGALARRGAKVTVLEGFGWLMPRQLNEAAGRRLASHIESLGVKLITPAKVKEIVGDERVAGVLLEDGRTLAADMVIISTGVRPNSYLARRAGLDVKGGIVVDNHLATSHPDILAAGDIAEHRGIVYGTWSPAQYMGSIAGLNAVGTPTEFGGIPRSNTLKVLGIDLLSIGRFEPEDGSYQVLDQDDGDCYLRFVFRDSRLAGAILLGDTSIAAQLSKAVTDGADMSALLARRPTARDVQAHFAQLA